MNTQIQNAPEALSEATTRDELVNVFVLAEKPKAQFRIGAESEKFGVHEVSGRPLGYGGDFSVCQVLGSLCEEHGWSPSRETEGGPVLGAQRGNASITLEPGAQLELSGAALFDLHQVGQEAMEHLRELGPVSKRLGIAWLTTGFHPLASLASLPWVPKQRYPIMREYLPQKGKAGLDMMQRTCTTQGNFDWQDERDAMLKLRVALKLSPLVQAWFSNGPFKEGRVSDLLSERGVVWQHMDPARSGLIERMWTALPSYEDYVEWALDAGMFLIWRDGHIIKNTGQPFRDFLENGFEGQRATLADWRLHLATLFPEVRLKNTLEVRSVDALPPELSLASLAVWTGILYDEQSLQAAHELLAGWDYAGVEAQRPALCARALHVSLFGRSGFEWARELCELARSGLVRRAALDLDGRDESVHLAPAWEILESRKVPAERARQRWEQTGSFIEATRVQLPE